MEMGGKLILLFSRHACAVCRTAFRSWRYGEGYMKMRPQDATDIAVQARGLCKFRLNSLFEEWLDSVPPLDQSLVSDKQMAMQKCEGCIGALPEPILPHSLRKKWNMCMPMEPMDIWCVSDPHPSLCLPSCCD